MKSLFKDIFESKPDIDSTLFNLEFARKQTEREAKKSLAAEQALKNKVKKHMLAGEMEIAKIHAESAIMKKNEALHYLKLAANLDAVKSKIKSAQANQQIAKSIAGVNKGLESLTRDFSLEKVQKIMNNFQGVFQDLDVNSSVLNDSLGTSMSTSAPSSEVDALLKEVSEANNLELNKELSNIDLPSDISSIDREDPGRDQELEDRLKMLRS